MSNTAVLTKPMQAAKKTRITLDLSPELAEILETLSTRSSNKKSEVLRRSIVLMKVLSDATSEGKKFGIADSSDKLDTEIVGI